MTHRGKPFVGSTTRCMNSPWRRPSYGARFRRDSSSLLRRGARRLENARVLKPDSPPALSPLRAFCRRHGRPDLGRAQCCKSRNALYLFGGVRRSRL